MKQVTIYTTATCPFCIRALMLLNSKAVEYKQIAVDGNPSLRADMAQQAGRTSVPQIWVGDQHIGGCDELHQFERTGQLDALLNE